MLKRILMVCCILGLVATSLTTNSGCTRKTTVIEHDRDHGHHW